MEVGPFAGHLTAEGGAAARREAAVRQACRAHWLSELLTLWVLHAAEEGEQRRAGAEESRSSDAKSRKWQADEAAGNWFFKEKLWKDRIHLANTVRLLAL